MYQLVPGQFTAALCCVPSRRHSLPERDAPPPEAPQPAPRRTSPGAQPLEHLAAILHAHLMRGRSATETDLVARHYDGCWSIEETLRELLSAGGEHLRSMSLSGRSVAAFGIEPLAISRQERYQQLMETLLTGGLDMCRVRRISLGDAYRAILHLLEDQHDLRDATPVLPPDLDCEAAFYRAAWLYLDALARAHSCEQALLEALRRLHGEGLALEQLCPLDASTAHLASTGRTLCCLVESAPSYFFCDTPRSFYVGQSGACASYEPSTQLRPYEVLHPGSTAAASQVMLLIVRAWSDRRRPLIDLGWLDQIRLTLATQMHLPPPHPQGRLDPREPDSGEPQALREAMADFEARLAACPLDNTAASCKVIAAPCCELQRLDTFHDGGLTATALLQLLLLRRGLPMVQQTGEGLLSDGPKTLARHLQAHIRAHKARLQDMQHHFLDPRQARTPRPRR